MIRGKNKSNQCPFGLEIPSGCKNAGSYVSFMTPLDDSENKKDSHLEYNNKMLIQAINLNEPECVFASEIYEKKECVNCSFNKKGIPAASGLSGLNSGIDYPHVWKGTAESTFSAQVDSFDYYSDNQNRLIPNSIAKQKYLNLIKKYIGDDDNEIR